MGAQYSLRCKEEYLGWCDTEAGPGTSVSASRAAHRNLRHSDYAHLAFEDGRMHNYTDVQQELHSGIVETISRIPIDTEIIFVVRQKLRKYQEWIIRRLQILTIILADYRSLRCKWIRFSTKFLSPPPKEVEESTHCLYIRVSHIARGACSIFGHCTDQAAFDPDVEAVESSIICSENPWTGP